MLDQKAGPTAPAVVVLPSQIDFATQDQAYDRLYAAFASGATVVIADFTGTAFCDCGSLRHLVTVQHWAAARKAQLRLVIPPGGLIRRQAALMDLDHQLPVYPTLREALAAGPLPDPNFQGASPSVAARTVTMTDIIDLIAASHLHIVWWHAWLGGQGRRLGAPPPGPGLAETWDTVAALIDLHMAADEEVCAPAIYDQTPQGQVLAREGKQAHAEISELIGETRLHPPGTTPWWQLATMTLAAWSRLCDYEEHGPPAQCHRRADPALRQQLGRQWRAFRQARIRDRSYPDAPSQLPTCQLRLVRPATPRLADPAFCPLACTCQACDAQPAGIRSPRFSSCTVSVPWPTPP
jgi:anti-anti-sigma regulatory factor